MDIRMKKSFQYYELHAEVCKTFGHPKRLLIIDTLRGGEFSVSAIAEATNIDISNLSQHLHMLREKGLIAPRREGTNVYYSLAHPNIIKAYDLISEVLAKRIADRQEILTETVE
jgi:ArsR family transcriptional regulator